MLALGEMYFFIFALCDTERIYVLLYEDCCKVKGKKQEKKNVS